VKLMSQFLNDKDPADPSTTSLEYDVMMDKWAMMEALLGGTVSMRTAGGAYLPQHPEETDDNYNERLQVNILFNALELTLNNFVGRPFSEEVRLNTDVPDLLEEHAKNIDLQGNNLTTFCREWFREGLVKGFCHVLVDMPSMTPVEQSFRTLADDLSEGRRPFWQLVKPENLIFAEADIEVDPQTNQLRERYTHIRLREVITERVGFSQQLVEQIRVIEPGFFQIWREIKSRKRRKEWRVVESGPTGLDIVPLVTYYAQRDGFLRSKPPFEDLAHLNIRHWQSMSDQINILTVVRFPMLAVAGATENSGAVMRIGPRQLLSTKDANGRFYYIEHQGKAIESGWRELEKLEEDMESYGATFLTKRPGNQTATGRALDSAESVSALQDMTMRFINSVNHVMDLHVHWLGMDDGGTVTITTDFGPEEVTREDAALLMDLRKNRDISRVTYLKEAQRRGILSETFDAETDFSQLKDEDVALKPLQPQIPGTFAPVRGETPPTVGGGNQSDDPPQPKETT
jgi:hypothetical protein